MYCRMRNQWIILLSFVPFKQLVLHVILPKCWNPLGRCNTCHPIHSSSLLHIILIITTFVKSLWSPANVPKGFLKLFIPVSLKLHNHCFIFNSAHLLIPCSNQEEWLTFLNFTGAHLIPPVTSEFPTTSEWTHHLIQCKLCYPTSMGPIRNWITEKVRCVPWCDHSPCNNLKIIYPSGTIKMNF